MRMLSALIGLCLLVGCSGTAVTSTDRWLARNGGCCDTGEARVQQVAARFGAVIKQPVKVRVLDRDELRAYSFPSGEVIVTRGLVSALSDDELTAVIGHELGHLLNDGHASAALVGRVPDADVESAADAVSVKLLASMSLPEASMRTALQKVLVTVPSANPTRPAIAARIQRLP